MKPPNIWPSACSRVAELDLEFQHRTARSLSGSRSAPLQRSRYRPLGYYFNVQFTNTGSHLADGEGPWKMEQNHRMLLESGPNVQLSIVNSGNTREFPFTLSAHAKMIWTSPPTIASIFWSSSASVTGGAKA